MFTILTIALVLLAMAAIVVDPVVTEYQRGKKIYNAELGKRFVSDYALPIPIINDSYRLFLYYLRLHEQEFKSLTKWKELMNLIEHNFDGKPHRFLKEFYSNREKIVQWFHNNPAQLAFNSMDMNRFAVSNRPNVTSKNIYNGEAVGKKFISVDLNKANYQAMKYVNPDLVANTNTYAEFIESFGFSEAMTHYFIDSKYLRQVVFGQSNPKRQVIVETYMTYKVWERWQDLYQNAEIVSFSNDEFVLRVPEGTSQRLLHNIAKDFVEEVKTALRIDVKVKVFTVDQWNLIPKGHNRHAVTFFGRNVMDGPDENEVKTELMCLPLNYRAIATKLMRGQRVTKTDKLFPYEKHKAQLCETFKLVKGKWPFEGKDKKKKG